MADEKFNPEEEDSGLGNLPPLSDFDSSDEESGSNLPPLGNIESDADIQAGRPTPADMGTPSDLQMNTPKPGQGGFSPQFTPSEGSKPPEFDDAPTFNTPDSDVDTPEPAGFGFQDVAADSDFSPETPELGPGPDSDVETPMFDSAFGGDSGEFGAGDSPTSGTGAPTQAMETPMFEASPTPEVGDDFGFDQDAFGGAPAAGAAGAGFGAGAGGFGREDIGTPIPDFSPDTGMPTHTPTGGMTAAAAPPPRGGTSKAALAVAAVVALLIGLLAGPFLAKMAGVGFLNPYATELEERDATITRLEGQVQRMTGETARGGESTMSPEERDRLINEVNQARTELEQATTELASLQTQVAEAESNLDLVLEDIESKNIEFVEAQEMLEELENTTAITEARHQGLLAENSRLTEQVGELEVADQRRAATKDALLHNLDLLLVRIEKSIPLTPNRYSKADRLAQAQQLRSQVQQAKWVDPQLMNAYTDLYLKELELSGSSQYFFAQIPVRDEAGNQTSKWAEALMNGTWSVYYRTLDGATVGIYRNTSDSAQQPRFTFIEDLPEGVRMEVEQQILASRPADFESKVAAIQEKADVYNTRSNMQRTFDSL